MNGSLLRETNDNKFIQIFPSLKVLCFSLSLKLTNGRRIFKSFNDFEE